MNATTRGVRNAFRNTIRTGSIVLILALSIGLIIAMLAARQAVNTKIESVKNAVGNTVTIAPAGVQGFEGGGEALTAAQMAEVTKVAHVTAVSQRLSDRLTTSNSNLVSAIEAGTLGQRRANESGTTSGGSTVPAPSGSPRAMQNFTPPVTITGVNSVNGTSTFGGSSLSWTSGQAFDASKDISEAVVGKNLATKNNLSVGSTFKAYGATIKVVGIYDAGNDFANNGVFMSLVTLQRLSSQSGSITSAAATVDSADNLATATTAIKEALGSKADVTSSQDAADQLVAPLSSVAHISLLSLLGAVTAGAVIILLAMLMIVRERRREIGVMKAIGARNGSIMWQFMVEAITLTTLALVVGLGIGIAAARPITDSLVSTSVGSTQSTQTAVGPGSGPRGMGPGAALRSVGTSSAQTLTNVQASVGWPALVLGMLAALSIAVLGSAIPALIISNIKPAEAMRNE